jgi:serine protease Do
VITEFNGKKVTDGRHLKLQVARTHPGETVSVKVFRDGSTRTIEVTVKELPGTEQLAKSDTRSSEETGTLKGVSVSDLDRAVRQQLKLPASVKGVVVTEVEPNSAAAEAGLLQGDVIQEINRKSVKSADETVKLTEKTEDKTTLLRVWRNGGSHYVVVDETKAG